MARVLIVDDDRDIRDLVELRLTRAGHEVLAAGDGPEALRLVDAEGAPDLAVLDVSMPGMDGHELLGALRERPAFAGVPVVFLSAHADERDVAAGRALGAGYVLKPFSAEELRRAVGAALER